MLTKESGNNYSTPIKGHHSVHILPNVPIFNRKPLLSHINSYTKFEENFADRRDGYGDVLLGIKNHLIYETLETRDDVEAVFAKIPLDKDKTLRPLFAGQQELLNLDYYFQDGGKKRAQTNQSFFKIK